MINTAQTWLYQMRGRIKLGGADAGSRFASLRSTRERFSEMTFARTPQPG
jgi:hypothetical protein